MLYQVSLHRESPASFSKAGQNLTKAVTATDKSLCLCLRILHPILDSESSLTEEVGKQLRVPVLELNLHAMGLRYRWWTWVRRRYYSTSFFSLTHIFGKEPFRLFYKNVSFLTLSISSTSVWETLCTKFKWPCTSGCTIKRSCGVYKIA